MKHKFREYLLLILGTFSTSLGYLWFIVPNRLAPGGVSGIATIIHFLTGFPIGVLIILFNIPLFLVSWKSLGLEFGIKSLIGTLCLSLFIDLLPIKPLVTDQPLLAAVFGGLLVGSGIGLTFQAGGSTGGVDIAGRLLHKKQPGTSIGSFILVIDFFVVFTAGVINGPMTALYSLITVFIAAKSVDYIQDGYRAAKAYYIISDNSKSIAQRINTQLNRGVTIINASGGYTGTPKNMLMCLVIRSDVAALRRIVKEEDEKAFVFVLNASEVMGEGFGPKDRNIFSKKRN